MTDPSILDRVLLRDRAIVLACLVVIMGLAAVYTVVGIGALEMTTRASDMVMTPAAWTPALKDTRRSHGRDLRPSSQGIFQRG
jgi:hypothetical protein